MDVASDPYKLRFAWWNTGLVPRRGSRTRSGSYRRTVIGVIRYLLETAEVDVLALGEMSPAEIETIRDAIDMPLRSFVDHDGGTGLCALYRGEKLGIVRDSVLVDRFVDKELRRSCSLVFEFVDSAWLMQLVLCHWPSRGRDTQNVRERDRLANSLNVRRQQTQPGDWGLPLVVMGDFNDEPFDKSLTDHLQGSRDRGLVRQRRSLLYNPFWRHLGERQNLEEELAGRLASGSHFYRSDQLTRWFTMDQALVSHHLLGDGEWVLRESEAGIIQLSLLIDEGGKMTPAFDHLPITLTIERSDERRSDSNA